MRLSNPSSIKYGFQIECAMRGCDVENGFDLGRTARSPCLPKSFYVEYSVVLTKARGVPGR